jgi:hypothetical protein
MATMKKAVAKKASSLKKQLKPLGADKAELRKAAAKKDPMKASARSHQGDLARMSGETAATKKFNADKKAGIRSPENKPSRAFVAGKKAERRTLKSFK